jgi:ketosteroid isomerase-like protein
MKISTHFSFSRRHFGRFLSLGVLSTAFLAPAHAAAAPVAVAAEVEAAFNQFRHAWENEDLGAAFGAFSPDAVAYDPAPPGKYANPAEIRKWIADTFQALNHITIPVSDVKIHTAGAVAWLTAHYQFKYQADGKPSVDEGNVSIVWVKQADASYKIAVFHASIPPAAPPAPPSAVKVTVGVN